MAITVNINFLLFFRTISNTKVTLFLYTRQYIQYYQLSIMERGVGYTLHKITGEVHVLATSDTQLYKIDASVSYIQKVGPALIQKIIHIHSFQNKSLIFSRLYKTDQLIGLSIRPWIQTSCVRTSHWSSFFFFKFGCTFNT